MDVLLHLLEGVVDAFPDFLLLLLALLLVVSDRIEGRHELGSDVLHEQSHSDLLQGVFRDESVFGLELLLQVPADQVALCQSIVSVDDRRDLSVGLRVSTQSPSIDLSELLGFFLEVDLHFLEGKSFFKHGQPRSLSEGTNRVVN